jgi:hypothetical protein
MDAEPWHAPTFAAESIQRVLAAFDFTETELLTGRSRLAYAARAALLYRLRFIEGRSRAECAQALGKSYPAYTNPVLFQAVARWVADPRTRPAFVAATEGP